MDPSLPTYHLLAAALCLKPGDVVECSIESIATLRTYIV